MIPDYPLGETIDFKFTTRAFATGVPTTLAGTPAVEIYEDNSVTQITGAETLTVDFDSVTGLNNLRVVATSANGFESGKSYAAIISTGTVDSVSVVGEVVAQFSIERSPALRPTTAGRTLDVTSTGAAGIDWGNVENPTTAVDLSATDIQLCDTVTTNSDMRGTDNAALASVLGALADAAAAGDPTSSDTVMQYMKQVVNILAGSAGVATFPAEAAPGNAVSLAEVLRAVHADVTGLNGDAMRGTDSAATASALSTHDGKLDTVDANVDTLLTRITSTIFSGITSMAEWLGLIAGKQAGDATALTEIKATGAGSGTYDPTTDSNEAVRDTAPLGTAMRGTDSAATASALATAQADLDTITGTDGATLATTQGNYAPAKAGDSMDVSSISGDSTAADRLEAMMDGIIVAQVNDASATATAFAADGFTEATDDHFNGRLITFITGALNGQQTAISDYDAAGGAQGSQQFTVDALTEAPANDVYFVIH